ncbi:MAG: glycosyltransferase family 39 protein [Anaerolineae bacterium]
MEDESRLPSSPLPSPFSILLLLTLLGFALRIYRLEYQSLWYDEGFSVWLASKDLAAITTGDFNPPLYIYLLHFWIQLAGTSEFAARFLSLFFSVLIIPLGYRVSKELFDRPTGLVTAFLLAIAPLHLWYAQEVRMYAQVTALSLLATLALLRALGGRRRAWLVYVAATVAAVYTHYYAWMIVAAQGAFVLWSVIRVWSGRAWRRAQVLGAVAGRRATPSPPRPFLFWLLSQIVLILAALPWMPFLIDHYRHQTLSYWPGRLSFQWVAERTFLAFSVGETLNGDLARWAMIGFLTLIAIGVLGSLARDRGSLDSVVLSTLLLVVPLVALYLIVRDRPKFAPRYLMVASPALYLLAAAGLRAIWPRRTDAILVRLIGSAVALGALVFLSATAVQSASNMYFDPTYAREDFRGLAQFLEQNVGEDEGILLLSGHFFPVFEYYYHRDNWVPVPHHPTPSPSVADVVTLDVAEELDRFAANHRGLWVVLWQDEVVDPNGVVLALLDRAGQQAPIEAQFHGLRLRYYRLPPTALFTSEIGHPLGLSPVAEVRLAGYDVLHEPTPADQPVDVLLYWQALAPMNRNYKVSLRLRDEQGLLWGMEDSQLAGFWYPTYRWPTGEVVLGRHPVQLPAGIPPGEYRLDMIFYAAENHFEPLEMHLGQVAIDRPATPPTVEELSIPHPMTAFFGGLELLGYGLQATETTPGGEMDITLFWQAHQGPGIDRRLQLQLGDSTIPISPAYPMDQWQAGDVFRTQHRIRVPADNDGGIQPLQVAVFDPAGVALAPPARLTDLTVAIPHRRFDVPTDISHRERVELGPNVTFLGYDIEPQTAKPGDNFHLTLYWRALGPTDKSYKVFTHLMNVDVGMWGQEDSFPVNETRPTTGWLPGEVIVDPYDIRVDPAAPAGEYFIEVGMYDPETLERLPAVAGGQRLTKDRILVEGIRVER